MGQRQRGQARAEALLHHIVAQITRESVASTTRSAARVEKRRRAKRRTSTIKLGVLLPIVFALTLLNVASGGVPDTLRTDRAEDDRRARDSAMSFVVDEIELYREEHGGLPHDLREIDVPEFGEWDYQRQTDASYVVELIDGGAAVRFDSSAATDARRFREEVTE